MSRPCHRSRSHRTILSLVRRYQMWLGPTCFLIISKQRKRCAVYNPLLIILTAFRAVSATTTNSRRRMFQTIPLSTQFIALHSECERHYSTSSTFMVNWPQLSRHKRLANNLRARLLSSSCLRPAQCNCCIYWWLAILYITRYRPTIVHIMNNMIWWPYTTQTHGYIKLYTIYATETHHVCSRGSKISMTNRSILQTLPRIT